MKLLNENENAIIVFDDILGSTLSRCIDQVFIGGRHNKIDILKLVTNKIFNVDLASLPDKKHCLILQNKCLLIRKF